MAELCETASLWSDSVGMITLFAAHSLGLTFLVVILVAPEKNLRIHSLCKTVEGKGCRTSLHPKVLGADKEKDEDFIVQYVEFS